MKGGVYISGVYLNVWGVLGYLLLTVVVIVGLGFLFHYFINSHTQKRTTVPTVKSTMDHFEDYAPADLTPKSENEVVVALFSAEWCPHCTAYKSTWEELKASPDKTTSSGKTIRFVDVDCTKEPPAEASTYKVEGYPTVVAISKSSNKHVSERSTLKGIKSEVDSM